MAESVAEGKLASASYRNSHVLDGFTWRPPSAEERQLGIGKSSGGQLFFIVSDHILYLVEN